MFQRKSKHVLRCPNESVRCNKGFSILCKHKQMQVHRFDNRVHNSCHQSQYIEAGVIIHYRIHTYNISTETIFSRKMVIIYSSVSDANRRLGHSSYDNVMVLIQDFLSDLYCFFFRIIIVLFNSVKYFVCKP